MAPERWIEAIGLAEETYDPADNGGREWGDLTGEEQHDLALEAMYGLVD